MAPDIDRLSQKIQQIKDLDLKSTDYKTVLEKTKSLIEDFYIVVSMPYRWTTLYRFRTLEKEDYLKNISELKYNLNVQNFGRANAIGQSRFYASPNFDCCAYEVGLGEKINYAICLESQMRDNVGNLKFCGLGLSDDSYFVKEGSSEQTHWGARKRQTIEKFCEQNFHPEEIELRLKINNLIDDFFNEQYRKEVVDSHDYKITAAVTELLLDINKLDGIVYPSIQTKKLFLNVAMTPSAYDKCFKPHRVEFISRNSKGIKHVPAAEIKGDVITW